MAIYVTRWFARWANQQGLPDEALCRAVHEMYRGLYEADLGGRLLKKRIARPGGGKSGGFRTLVATNMGDRWIFLYGFSKNDQENVELQELRGLKAWATALVDMSSRDLDDMQKRGAITRVDSDA
jgi:hypothetical protein